MDLSSRPGGGWGWGYPSPMWGAKKKVLEPLTGGLSSIKKVLEPFWLILFLKIHSRHSMRGYLLSRLLVFGWLRKPPFPLSSAHTSSSGEIQQPLPEDPFPELRSDYCSEDCLLQPRKSVPTTPEFCGISLETSPRILRITWKHAAGTPETCSGDCRKHVVEIHWTHCGHPPDTLPVPSRHAAGTPCLTGGSALDKLQVPSRYTAGASKNAAEFPESLSSYQNKRKLRKYTGGGGESRRHCYWYPFATGVRGIGQAHIWSWVTHEWVLSRTPSQDAPFAFIPFLLGLSFGPSLSHCRFLQPSDWSKPNLEGWCPEYFPGWFYDSIFTGLVAPLHLLLFWLLTYYWWKFCVLT